MTLEHARQAVTEFNSYPYVDVHCWQFTTSSLETMIKAIVDLGLLPPPTSLEVLQLDAEIGMLITW